VYAGFAGAGEVGQLLEAAVLGAPVEEVGTRNRGVAIARLQVAVRDVHHAIGLIERQRPQHHCIDNAEDRRRCADAERQREDRRRGESWLANQCPNAVAHVLQQVVHAAFDGNGPDKG
jgi:hypothetical protein